MSKLPNFWQFFNLTSEPIIPSLYWDSYSYEERIKKICDKIFAILNYLKLVMELLNEFDDRLTVLEELYNEIDRRISELEKLIDYINDLFDIIANEYSESSTYAVGTYVIYNRKLYKCNTAITHGEAWNSAKWTQVQIGTELTALFHAIDYLEGEISNIISKCLSVIGPSYNSSSTYNEGDYVIHNNKLYKNTTAITTPEPFNQNKWYEINVAYELKNIYDIIDSIAPDDGLSLKFASASSSAAKTIGAYFPLIFTSQQRRNVSGQNDTIPYIIDSTGMQIAGITQVLSSGRYDHPEDVTNPCILYNDNNLTITINNLSYKPMIYICDGNSSAIVIAKSITGLIYIFGKEGNTWNVKITNFIESNDESSAASSSISNPHAIFYVAE